MLVARACIILHRHSLPWPYMSLCIDARTLDASQLEHRVGTIGHVVAAVLTGREELPE